MVKKYQSLKMIRFVGFLSREEVNHYYQQSDCLLFSSKTETWGLPVTEAKEYGTSIIISDLPYAKESVGKYEKVKFFDPDNAVELAGIIKNFVNNSISYDPTKETIYEKPFVRNWDELVQFCMENKKNEN
jgi:glycosyltransferase involved in cell wall biosynthesis